MPDFDPNNKTYLADDPSEWVPQVFKLEDGYLPTGGGINDANGGGTMNRQAQDLANRTSWLKQKVDAIPGAYARKQDVTNAINALLGGAGNQVDTSRSWIDNRVATGKFFLTNQVNRFAGANFPPQREGPPHPTPYPIGNGGGSGHFSLVKFGDSRQALLKPSAQRSVLMSVASLRPNIDHWSERVDMAATFRWTERLNLHEAVANHFSLAVNEDGTQFLMNPNQMYFGRIRASDLLLLDANDPDVMSQPGAPDPTAWGLHGSIHRHCPHARCVMHVHSIFATVLASLADSNMPPIDQNTATFYNRYVIDEAFGGLAFESEGERCASMLSDPKKKVMIMGNHGVLIIGSDPADAFNRLYYFERAAETYIRALQTGQPLRVLSDEIAEKTAQELDDYPDQAQAHLREIKALLDAEGSDYAT